MMSRKCQTLSAIWWGAPSTKDSGENLVSHEVAGLNRGGRADNSYPTVTTHYWYIKES